MRFPALWCLLAVICLAVFSQAQQGAPAKTTLQAGGDTLTILRDGYGVPHVFACTLRGLFYGDGYAVAEDRLWQLEQYRRDAQGRLAEIQGREALARDREVRLLGYTPAGCAKV